MCISSSCENIAPLIVFKGDRNATLEKKLQDYANTKSQKIFVLCQPNSWTDNDVFMFWNNNVFFNNKIVRNNISKILILDRATTHYDPDFVQNFKEMNSKFLLLLPVLTR